MRRLATFAIALWSAGCGEGTDGGSPGSFSFAPAGEALPTGAVRGRTPLLVDLDGDRDLDLFLSARGERPWVLANDGHGYFTEIPQPATLPAVDTGDAAAGDVDGDGDVDVWLATFESGPDVLLRNDGQGVFLPADADEIAAVDDRTTGVALVDVDEDGDLDAVTANWQGTEAQAAGLRLFENVGGSFAERSEQRLPADPTPTFGVTPLDANGDGHVDLFVGHDGSAPRLLLGDGAGAFAFAPAGTTPPESRACRSSSAADLDDDGDVDVVLAATGGARVWLNDGHGRMRDATDELVGGPRGHVERVTAADLDGDRDVDFALARWTAEGNLLLRNDGTGRLFDYRANLGEPGTETDAAFAVGDVDGDRALDLLLSRDGAPPLLLLQQPLAQ